MKTMKAIEAAKSANGLVAFFFYDTIIEDIESLCKMLNIKAKCYTFRTDKDCEVLIKKAIEEGVVLSIGGVMNQKYAERYGLNHITIENTEESIINAIETAKQILLVQKEESKKQMELNLQLERYKAVVNYTHDAIISYDENGIIDVINPIAENIIKTAPGYAKGMRIDRIIRNSDMFNAYSLNEQQLNYITNINGTYVSANKVPIATDETIAAGIAIATMVLAVDYKKGIYVLSGKEALKGAPLSTMLLLGGSMAMGNAFTDAGCAEWVAGNLTALSNMPQIVIIIAVGLVTALLTEVTTNAVVVASFLPVLAGIGRAIGMDPLQLMLTCMIASNFAFMLPPGTPPNAIAYSSGAFEVSDLMKAGLGLKIIGLIVFPLLMYFVTFGIFNVGM